LSIIIDTNEPAERTAGCSPAPPLIIWAYVIYLRYWVLVVIDNGNTKELAESAQEKI